MLQDFEMPNREGMTFRHAGLVDYAELRARQELWKDCQVDHLGFATESEFTKPVGAKEVLAAAEAMLVDVWLKADGVAPNLARDAARLLAGIDVPSSSAKRKPFDLSGVKEPNGAPSNIFGPAGLGTGINSALGSLKGRITAASAPEPSLDVTNQGYQLNFAGSKIDLPKKGTAYDASGLHDKLKEIKNQFPDLHRLQVTNAETLSVSEFELITDASVTAGFPEITFK
jgi:hypothetical protein